MKDEIKWRLTGDLPAYLEVSAVLSTLEKAMQAWCKPLGLKSPYASNTDCDVTFTFVENMPNDRWIAYANYDTNTIFFGRNKPDILDHRKSIPIKWCPLKTGFFSGLRRLFQNGQDLMTIALHEIGHAAFHLEHTGDRTSVMFHAAESQGLSDRPSQEDIHMAYSYIKSLD